MWQALPSPLLRIYTWEDTSVVYNSLSGNTHLLGEAAAYILFELQRRQMGTMDVASSLAAIYQAELDSEVLLQTENILSELEALTLIEQPLS